MTFQLNFCSLHPSSSPQPEWSFRTASLALPLRTLQVGGKGVTSKLSGPIWSGPCLLFLPHIALRPASTLCVPVKGSYVVSPGWAM